MRFDKYELESDFLKPARLVIEELENEFGWSSTKRGSLSCSAKFGVQLVSFIDAAFFSPIAHDNRKKFKVSQGNSCVSNFYFPRQWFGIASRAGDLQGSRRERMGIVVRPKLKKHSWGSLYCSSQEFTAIRLTDLYALTVSISLSVASGSKNSTWIGASLQPGFNSSLILMNSSIRRSSIGFISIRSESCILYLLLK